VRACRGKLLGLGGASKAKGGGSKKSKNCAGKTVVTVKGGRKPRDCSMGNLGKSIANSTKPGKRGVRKKNIPIKVTGARDQNKGNSGAPEGRSTNK